MLSPVPLPLWSVSLSDAPMTAGPSPPPCLALLHPPRSPPRLALILLAWLSSSSPGLPPPRLALLHPPPSSSPGQFFLFCQIFPVVLFLCVGSTVAEWQHSCLIARRFGSIPGSSRPFCVEFYMFLPVSGWVSSGYSGFPHQPKHERPSRQLLL
ncbi:hypothetical protein NQD34_007662 [Periophthalmus magnuspinnatus]|nr:hypothetical protein NQD34_007662 [Periophthalmus magnuspinnatus]